MSSSSRANTERREGNIRRGTAISVGLSRSEISPNLSQGEGQELAAEPREGPIAQCGLRPLEFLGEKGGLAKASRRNATVADGDATIKFGNTLGSDLGNKQGYKSFLIILVSRTIPRDKCTSLYCSHYRSQHRSVLHTDGWRPSALSSHQHCELEPASIALAGRKLDQYRKQCTLRRFNDFRTNCTERWAIYCNGSQSLSVARSVTVILID